MARATLSPAVHENTVARHMKPDEDDQILKSLHAAVLLARQICDRAITMTGVVLNNALATEPARHKQARTAGFELLEKATRELDIATRATTVEIHLIRSKLRGCAAPALVRLPRPGVRDQPMTIETAVSAMERHKAEFLRLIAEGETVLGAARAIGINEHAFYGARKTDQAFRDAWASAYESSAVERAALMKRRGRDAPAAKTRHGPPPPGGTKRTPLYRRRFLRALASGCSVTRAAEQADISYLTVLNWRRDDPDFAAAWQIAIQAGIDRLEDEAFRRGVVGYDEPVYYNGEVVGADDDPPVPPLTLIKGDKQQ